jgi:hypothetical protein
LRLSVNDIKDEVVPVAFPYFGSTQHPHFACTSHDAVQVRNVPAKKIKLADGSEALVATVYDLTLAQYGLDRGLGGANVAKTYRRRRALYPRLAGKSDRRTARANHHRGPPVRRKRRQDPRQVDGHHRRGDEPLVSHGHELPGRHQPADDVRLRRPERRRLVALRRAGEAAPANRLDGAGLRAGLAPPAPAHEFDLVLVHPHQPVAVRKNQDGRDSLAAGRSGTVAGRANRLQRAGGADGLAAERPAVESESAGSRQSGGGGGRRRDRLRGEKPEIRQARLRLRRPR